MHPNPTIAAVHISASDAALRRLLGGMSIFTMLMTIPGPGHMGRPSGSGGFDPIVGRLPRLCHSLALVRDTET